MLKIDLHVHTVESGHAFNTLYEIAKEAGILYPYLGNISMEEYSNTLCPNCGNLCIKRSGFSVSLDGIKNGRCAICDNRIHLIINTSN